MSRAITFEVDQVTLAKRAKRRLIDDTVARLLDSEQLPEIARVKIFIVSFAYFGQNRDGDYLPAEVGLAEYSVRDGITNLWHDYIAQDELNVDDMFAVNLHRLNTHQLPLPPNAIGERRYDVLARKLLDCLDGIGTVEHLPLFTLDRDLPMVENIVEQLMRTVARELDGTRLVVCPLALFFHGLMLKSRHKQQGCRRKRAVPSTFVAAAMLEEDIYQYRRELACDYHCVLDLSRCCPLSLVTRWTYTISGSCCEDFGVALVPGVHVPNKKHVLGYRDLSGSGADQENPSDDKHRTETPRSDRTGVREPLTAIVLDQSTQLTSPGSSAMRASIVKSNETVGGETMTLADRLGVVTLTGGRGRSKPSGRSHTKITSEWRLYGRGRALVNRNR